MQAYSHDVDEDTVGVEDSMEILLEQLLKQNKGGSVVSIYVEATDNSIKIHQTHGRDFFPPRDYLFFLKKKKVREAFSGKGKDY